MNLNISVWSLKRRTTSALQRAAGLSGSFLFWSASSSDELRWHQCRSVCIWNCFISFTCVCVCVCVFSLAYVSLSECVCGVFNNIHAECMLKDDGGAVMFWVNNLWFFMSHMLQRSFWSITHTHTHTHTLTSCIVLYDIFLYMYTHTHRHTQTHAC